MNSNPHASRTDNVKAPNKMSAHLRSGDEPQMQAEQPETTIELSSLMDAKVAHGALRIKCTQIKTRLGTMTACASEQGVCILEFDDSSRVARQIARCRRLSSASFLMGRNAHLSVLRKELRDFLAGKLTEFSVPLDLQGTEFQCAVWNALLTLPFGARINYSELAEMAGKPDAVRAAGAANGANPLSIIVPCHRVLGRNGSLTGYGGGIERKAWLLEHESSGKKLG